MARVKNHRVVIYDSHGEQIGQYYLPSAKAIQVAKDRQAKGQIVHIRPPIR